MTWMRFVSLMFLLVAVMYFAGGEKSQGSAFVAIALVFFVVGERRPQGSD